METTAAIGYTPLQNKIDAELVKLTTKHSALVEFIQSPIFKDLGPLHTGLIIKQEGIMKEYMDILETRLDALDGTFELPTIEGLDY